jgi:hypothetical protein
MNIIKKFLFLTLCSSVFFQKKMPNSESISFDTLDKEEIKNYLECILASIRCALEDCAVEINPSYSQDKELIISNFKFSSNHFENENFHFVRGLNVSFYSRLVSCIEEKFSDEEKDEYAQAINILKNRPFIEENVVRKTYEWFLRKIQRQSKERVIDYICFLEAVFYCAEYDLCRVEDKRGDRVVYLEKKSFILSIEKKYRMFFDNYDFGFDEVFMDDENFVIKNVEIFNYLKNIAHRFPLYLSIVEEKLNLEEKEKYKKEIDFLRNNVNFSLK